MRYIHKITTFYRLHSIFKNIFKYRKKKGKKLNSQENFFFLENKKRKNLKIYSFKYKIFTLLNMNN